MTKFNEDWVVQPHGEWMALGEGISTIAGEIKMPLGNFPRRMTAVVLSGGRLAVWSPMPLRDAEMAQLEAMGEVTFLIVPGVSHRLDIQAWKKRYPKAKVVCASGARQAVEEAVPVDGVDDVLADDAVHLELAPGVANKEAILWVNRPDGTTLVVNDILANVRHPHGVGANIMARLLGFGVDHPRVPRIGKRLFLKDTAAMAAAFRDWAKMPNLRQIVVSHGDVIKSPVEALERAAYDLER